MTGSGKTGLCLALARRGGHRRHSGARRSTPRAISRNLLLTFPELRAGGLPALDQRGGCARAEGLSPADYARQQAELWKKGLAEWGEDGARIQRLRDGRRLRDLHAGQRGGAPGLRSSKSFARRRRRSRRTASCSATASSARPRACSVSCGIEPPIHQSREHILISTILDAAWKAGRDLDLADAHRADPDAARHAASACWISSPSIRRRSGSSSRWRSTTSLAAPGFAAWMEGEALDIDAHARTPEGKPRISIFSIAHLGDAERMFFVSLLLNETARVDARAVRHHEPARRPLHGRDLRLLSAGGEPAVEAAAAHAAQAGARVRAGRGAGDAESRWTSTTRGWPTRARGSSGACRPSATRRACWTASRAPPPGPGLASIAGRWRRSIAGLGNRIFLDEQCHDDGPEVFEIRWALSYLGARSTRSQIKTLMAGRRAPASAPAPARTAPRHPARASGNVATTAQAGASLRMFRSASFPLRGPAPASRRVGLPADAPRRRRGALRRREEGPRRGRSGHAGREHHRRCHRRGLGSRRRARPEPRRSRVLARAGRRLCRPCPLPRARPRATKSGAKDLAAWLFRNRRLDVLSCPRLKAFSRPGRRKAISVRASSTRATRRETRWSRPFAKKYAPKIAALQEKIRRAEQLVERESSRSSNRESGGDLHRGHSDRGGARPQGHQRGQRWPRHHRGPRRRSRAQGAAGRGPRPGDGGSSAGPARGDGGGLPGGDGDARRAEAMPSPDLSTRSACARPSRNISVTLSDASRGRPRGGTGPVSSRRPGGSAAPAQLAMRRGGSRSVCGGGLLGRPASESGRLRGGNGAHGRGGSLWGHHRSRIRRSLGRYSRTVTTTSADAQRWFDRGLNWCFGYHHEEAIACFREGAGDGEPGDG